ncbi:MAG: DUF2520 domain-containing protein [Porphyromonadaceae bacterium]|nr:DUF2520 domain-containing protein [Porphyromonadaceae bacterium]
MEHKLKVVLLGTGNVAYHLAKRLSQLADFVLVQIYGRHLDKAREVAAAVGSQPEAIDQTKQIAPDADYYIFSVSDSALPTVWDSMPPTSGIWLHTAGSVGLSLMQPYHTACGVLYPLQTFSRERLLEWSNLPIYIEAVDEASRRPIEHLARALSPVVYEATSEQRQQIHLAAVLACNFVNHLLALSEEWMLSHALEPKALLPLIEETVAKVKELPAREAQTGPAKRGDCTTMLKHQTMLEQVNPDLAKLYETLSRSIGQMYAPNSNQRLKQR